MLPNLTILQGDALEKLRELPAESVHCCMTSPPYWGLRDYSTNGQLGLEKTPEEYVAKMVEIFREVRRVLRKDGTLWLNLGDNYVSTARTSEGGPVNLGNTERNLNIREHAFVSAGGKLKSKDLCGIPWRVAFALQADGWYLRSDIIWSKPNPMPESVTDRPTKAHEYLFLLTKSSRYFYDAEAIKEKSEHIQGPRPFGEAGNGKQNLDRRDDFYSGDSGSRNKRSVWTVATAPFSDWTETVRWKRVEAGARGDGTRRIVSPNSLSDGGLFDLLATVLYDEHGEKSLTDICGICDRLSLEPRVGYVPSEKLRAYYFGDENLDSFLHRRLSVAIRRNNGKNKTDLFVATSLACKPSVERSCRIGRILEIHGWSEQDRDMLLSNTWPDDWPVHLWDKILYHIGDNASREGMYRKASEMSSHFATYPPDLIKPCILAGTSARGCCAKCGAPWERITETPKIPEEIRNRGDETKMSFHSRQIGGGQAIQDWREQNGTKTIGWQPTCPHDGRTNSAYSEGSNAHRIALFRQAARERGGEYENKNQTIGWNESCDCSEPPIPCTVLDPFAGSGTTGAVSLELGRHAILIELNPKYVELIQQRCNTTPGLVLA